VCCDVAHVVAILAAAEPYLLCLVVDECLLGFYQGTLGAHGQCEPLTLVGILAEAIAIRLVAGTTTLIGAQDVLPIVASPIVQPRPFVIVLAISPGQPSLDTPILAHQALIVITHLVNIFL
jgi:hypothetical protein